MKRFLALFAVCTALCLMMAPAVTYAQHDDPDMEWEDMEEEERAEDVGDNASTSDILYVRWGGKTAIKGLVSEFTSRVLADERINEHFAETDKAIFRMQLVGQLSDASGGPMFMGKALKIMFQDMGLADEDFTHLTEDLSLAMDWFEFDQVEKDKLLVKLRLKTPEAPPETSEEATETSASATPENF